MLKADLEIAYQKLQKKHDDFKDKVVKGLKQVIDDTCNDSTEHIETFCAEVGIPFPKQIIRVEIPYGKSIGTIEDEDYNTIDYDEVYD